MSERRVWAIPPAPPRSVTELDGADWHGSKRVTVRFVRVPGGWMRADTEVVISWPNVFRHYAPLTDATP